MSIDQPEKSLFDIQGRTAVITGGSGGLGSAMAYGLAAAGASVAILSRHEESACKVADEIVACGGKALGIACDVVERSAIEAAYEQVTRAFGPVDILVNGAGGNQPGAVTSP